MMNTSINETTTTFKTLEQQIFQAACQWARELTAELLEAYDDTLAKERERSKLRNKGKRSTSIKTLYGEVPYSRRVYAAQSETGKVSYRYLLDEALSMDKIGMMSVNLTEHIAAAVVESPFRVAADLISRTSGQSISHGGVWNLVQKLGEKLEQEETAAVKEMDAGKKGGERSLPVLFEEMDGLWLRMQGERGAKAPGKEMKIATLYEGWKADHKGGSRLYGKQVLAGMEPSKDFLKKREAQIWKTYDLDEIQKRILNGDGGSWIGDPYGDEVIEQLDRFHVVKEIKQNIADKPYQKEVLKLLEAEKMEEVLEAVEIYADSVATGEEGDKREEHARKLLSYLQNHKEKLSHYDQRGIKLPEAPEGLVYKHMGVQENQNATVIGMRMKHGRKRWKEKSANHMAKLLYHHENGDLEERISHYTDSLPVEWTQAEAILSLSAAKAPKKDGKGSPYLDSRRCHMPIFDSSNAATRNMFRRFLMG